MLDRKKRGAFFTPSDVAHALVRWSVRSTHDEVLDPACGDGQFLQFHPRSFGCELDPPSAVAAIQRTRPQQLIVGDFFEYAEQTTKRFDCIVGNPPFIRYQAFSGVTRNRALRLCELHGIHLPALTSSWAPFIVVSSALLKPGGRLAMVVPAEIGHAKYASPLIEYLVRSFAAVRVIAIRNQLFPELSQDAWLLVADGFGTAGHDLRFVAVDQFNDKTLATKGEKITESDRDAWNNRLRPFLLSPRTRTYYRDVLVQNLAFRMGDAARCGIGYVTGANSFFHLKPSQVESLQIPSGVLQPSVRNGRQLPTGKLTKAHVKRWHTADEPHLLLRLKKGTEIPKQVERYLDSTSGKQARTSYKCRTREPWYVVPDVRVPDGFLSYMSGREVALVRNSARCSCTNSVHAVQMNLGWTFRDLSDGWESELRHLSCEVEGHPLGGGMLKIEPLEAARLVIPNENLKMNGSEAKQVRDAIETMQRWRHYEKKTNPVE